MNQRKQILVAIVATGFASSALAAVSADEAKQLGGPVLTEFGAEKAGNKEGTIPPFTGEGVKAPASFDPKKPLDRPDPYTNEKPLYSITAQNYTQYADKLDNFAEMFKKYPNFRMDVYPTHRTATLPKWVIDNTIKNATTCKAVENDLILQGCYGGTPFPIAKSGAQMMWNHLTTYVAEAWGIGGSQSFIVNNTGKTVMVASQVGTQQSDYYDPKRKTPAEPNSIYWEVRLDSTGPARAIGEKLVLIDALDNIHHGRRAYQYVPGQRRVKLAPDLNYDTPSPTGGGIMTMDGGKVFLGPLDRFDWKLVGKKEKLIPYNNFKMMTEHKTCNSDMVLTKNFVNPDCVRWELHRVWVVEATVKNGYRHIYPHSFFYWDEDGYGPGMSEHFDAAGKIYRFNIAVAYPFYAGEGQGMNADLNPVYDLQTGNYVFNGFTGNPGFGWAPTKRENAFYYSPEALAGEGVR